MRRNHWLKDGCLARRGNNGVSAAFSGDQSVAESDGVKNPSDRMSGFLFSLHSFISKNTHAKRVYAPKAVSISGSDSPAVFCSRLKRKPSTLISVGNRDPPPPTPPPKRQKSRCLIQVQMLNKGKKKTVDTLLGCEVFHFFSAVQNTGVM